MKYYNESSKTSHKERRRTDPSTELSPPSMQASDNALLVITNHSNSAVNLSRYSLAALLARQHQTKNIR